MRSRLVQGIALNLVGMSFYGDPFAKGAGWTDQNEIGRLWKRFLAFEQGQPGCHQAPDGMRSKLRGPFPDG